MWRHYVYIHKKADTGDVFYVGKGTIRKRNKAVNYERAECLSRRSKYWTSTANKHGVLIEIIASFFSDKDSQEFEKGLIAEYGRENLVNLTDGGDGSAGLNISDELREKRRIAAQWPRSEKWINAIRAARKNGGNGGVVNLGDKLPDAWRKNISNSVKGKSNSQYGKITAIARKVINMETGEKFDSVTAAAENIELNMKTLYSKLNGHRKNNTNLRFM